MHCHWIALFTVQYDTLVNFPYATILFLIQLIKLAIITKCSMLMQSVQIKNCVCTVE